MICLQEERIIMEAVAVLEIQMDRNHVDSISPSITLDTQANTLVSFS